MGTGETLPNGIMLAKEILAKTGASMSIFTRSGGAFAHVAKDGLKVRKAKESRAVRPSFALLTDLERYIARVYTGDEGSFAAADQVRGTASAGVPVDDRRSYADEGSLASSRLPSELEELSSADDEATLPLCCAPSFDGEIPQAARPESATKPSDGERRVTGSLRGSRGAAMPSREPRGAARSSRRSRGTAGSSPGPRGAARGSSPDLGRSLAERLENLDESFAQTVLRLIDERGMTDVEVYKRANMSRQLFAKIRRDDGYRPTKRTACALAFALGLNHEDALALLERAGFTLSHSSKFDIIVEFFLMRGIHDIFQVNEALYAFDQQLLG